MDDISQYAYQQYILLPLKLALKRWLGNYRLLSWMMFSYVGKRASSNILIMKPLKLANDNIMCSYILLSWMMFSCVGISTYLISCVG